MLLKQKQIFSKVECEKIINILKPKKEEWKNNDRKYGSTLINYCDENKWIFEKLKDFFEGEIGDEIILLKNYIHFHLYNEGDYFSKHNDNKKQRIYGVGCLLNIDFVGGDFIFYNKPETIIKKEIGNAYVFNVNIEHEITKIETGIRYSLLWFLENENLKIKNKKMI